MKKLTYQQKRFLKIVVNASAIMAGLYLIWNAIIILYYIGRLSGMAIAIEHYARTYELRRKVS